MAQLCHDYDSFCKFNTDVLVMVPNGPKMIGRYLDSHSVPFRILSDKGSQVASQYFQEKHFFALGTPTVFLVDTSGRIIYTHYASSLIEEPDNKEPLLVLTHMKGI